MIGAILAVIFFIFAVLDSIGGRPNTWQFIEIAAIFYCGMWGALIFGKLGTMEKEINKQQVLSILDRYLGLKKGEKDGSEGKKEISD